MKKMEKTIKEEKQQPSNTDKGRIDYLDVAKGIGIIWVCIGHAITNQVDTSQVNHVVMLRFLTQFHMALFFLINGMLYSDKYSVHPIMGYTKKLKAYYLPLIQFNLFYLLLHNLFVAGGLLPKEGEEGYYNAKTFLIHFVKVFFGKREQFAGAMWFLVALLVGVFFFITVDFLVIKFVGQKYRIVCLTVIIFASVLFNQLIYPIPVHHISRGINCLLFFYMGYLYKYFKLNHHLEKFKYIIFSGSLILSLLNAFFEQGPVVSVITTQGMPFLKYIRCVLLAVAGILMVLMFSQFPLIKESKLLKILGRYSLEIMALHFLCFKLVSLVIIKIYHMDMKHLADYPVIFGIGGAWWGLYTVVGFLVPTVIKSGWNTIKKKKVVYEGNKKYIKHGIRN